jgi:DNA-binding transcriptional ArsR family regulator
VKESGQASFEDWITALRERAPEEILQVRVRRLRQKALLELEPTAVPDEATLMRDRTAFVDLVEQIHAAHGDSDMFNREEEEQLFDELTGGTAYRDKLAAGIEHLWEHYLKSEWPRVHGAIDTSIKAFTSIEIPGETLEEQVMFVTERDQLPEPWLSTLRAAREVVFIPSVHIGPFMILLDFDGTTAYIAGHARIPEGSTIQTAEFTRSELLIRLDALSDETRLRLLELAASRGTITTQEAMDVLDLSQSSASRHLTQLTATGLLSVDASERTKRYRLNATRIDDVCDGLKNLLGATVRA